MLTLIEVFDEHFSKVKFDKKLGKALFQYQLRYINQNREHIEFFGSNLLGVHVVRFKDSDVLRLYNDILDIDYYRLVTDIRKVTTIQHEFKVSGDVFNLTCMYMLHRVLTSKDMSDQDRHRAAYDIGLIFFYRCIAAILSYYFRYPSDPKIAQAAYARLSNKFLIKKLGSWYRVMEYRAKDLVSTSGLHYKPLVAFNDDSLVVYAINDSQGRIRDLVKNYYSEFVKVHNEGESIAVTSSTYFDQEGEETIKEKTKSVESYVSYIRHVVIDKDSFIKDDLLNVVININSNTSYRMVKNILNWMTQHYNDGKHHDKVDEFLKLTIVHSFYLIQQHISSSHQRDYAYILNQLKNLYLSTRSSDPELMKLRELGEQIVQLSSDKTVSNSLIMASRTSVILYITLRALIK